MKIRISAVLCAVLAGVFLSASQASGWHTELWLDRGGFWTNRVCVTARNVSGKELKGLGVAVRLPPGAAGNDLRITDGNGRLLSFSVRDAEVVFPVTGAAGSVSRYFIYWGNPAALEIPYNSWSADADFPRKVKIETGPVETMTVKTVGENAKWPAGEWKWRVPVRIANFTDKRTEERLFRFRMAEATRSIPGPEWRFEHRGCPFKAEPNGSDLVFRHTIEPRTVSVFYVYVKPGKTVQAISGTEREAQGAVLPNDTGIDDKPVFPPGITVHAAHVGAVEIPVSASDCKLSVARAPLAALVFPEDPVKDETGGFRLELARNEKETLQLAVRSSVDEKDFSCEASPPVNASGKTLKAEPGWTECVFVDAPSTFYVHDTAPWELMYPHTRHPTSDGWSGMWPDPIMPGSRTVLKADATKAFRLLVSADADTEPGEYRGTLVWKSSGKEVRRDPYTVRVWNFGLPEKRNFSATFDVRGLSRQNQRDAVYSVLKEYGIQADQSCRTLSFSRDGKGDVTCDFTAFDRLTAEFFGKWGFTDAYFPRNPFYFFGWGRKPFDFLGEKAYEDGETDRSRLRPAYRTVVKAALKLFWDHLKEKGWEKRFVFYVSDEPYLKRPEIVAQLKAVCDLVHEVDPAIPTYSSTWRWCPEWEDSIDVWGVSASGLFPIEEIRRLRARGKRFWFTTDAQFPLDSPYMASESLFPVIAFFHGVEKYECWNCINFPKENAWKYGFGKFTPRFGIPGKKDRWVRVPAGDGVLLYPDKAGRKDVYAPTVRIDAVRDGLELFEYLVLLEKLSCPEADAVLEEFRRLATVPNAGGRYSKTMLPDPGKVGQLRSKAGSFIDSRSGQSENYRLRQMP